MPTRPCTEAVPMVGLVMRVRIFSKVLLPAPLWPRIPTTSPFMMSKLTSSSAQKWVAGASFLPPPKRRMTLAASPDMPPVSRSRYCLPRPFALIANSLKVPSPRNSQCIDQSALNLLEKQDTDDEHRHRNNPRHRQYDPGRRIA